MAWWTEQRLHPKAKSKFVVVFGSNFFIPSVKTVGKPKIDFDTKEYKLLNHKFNYPGNGTWQPIEIKFVDMNGLGDKSDTFDTSAFLWQILNNTGYAYPHLNGSSTVSNNPYYNNVTDQKAVANGGHHIATKLSFRDDPNTPDVEERSSFRTITTPEKSSTIANSFGKGLGGNIDYANADYARQKISIYQLSPESKFDEGIDKNPLGADIVECWHLINPIVKSIGWGDLAYDSDELIEYTLNIVYDWAIYDRSAIGKDFAVDALPYQQFMRNFGLAQAAIDQEIETQRELAEIQEAFEASGLGELPSLGNYRNGDVDPNIDIENVEKSFIDGDFDADGDGVISDAEKIFSQQNEAEIANILESADNLKEEIENEQSFVDNFTENNQNIFNIEGMDTSGTSNIFGIDTTPEYLEKAKEDFTTVAEATEAGYRESISDLSQDDADELAIKILEDNQDKLDARVEFFDSAANMPKGTPSQEEEIAAAKLNSEQKAFIAQQKKHVEEMEYLDRLSKEADDKERENIELQKADAEDEARLAEEAKYPYSTAEQRAKNQYEENRPKNENDIE